MGITIPLHLDLFQDLRCLDEFLDGTGRVRRIDAYQDVPHGNEGTGLPQELSRETVC